MATKRFHKISQAEVNVFDKIIEKASISDLEHLNDRLQHEINLSEKVITEGQEKDDR